MSVRGGTPGGRPATARPAAGRGLLRTLLPGPALALAYRREWLRGDLVGGLTVAAYLVPQVMAYATVAGLPPVTGLWASVPAMTIYAVFGSSQRLSVGPESTAALMTAATVGPLAAGDPERYARLAAGLAIVVGLLALVCRVIRLGFVADLLSKPILVGYMAGIALIMIVGQLGNLTGIPVEGGDVFARLVSLLERADQVHLGTLLLSAGVLAFLFVVPRRLPLLPAPLLAVLLATAVVSAFGLRERGITVVGEIPSGLPPLWLPALGDIEELLLPGFGVLLVGYTSNVLTARAFAARRDQRLDANQELLALGVANIGAGALHGFPVSSSGSRTMLGVVSGARTQLYSLVATGAVLAILLFAGPLLAGFPDAALGGLVVYAAIRLIDLPGFRRLAAFRRSELLLALAALVGVLAFGILYGVLLAVGLSVAEMLARVARPHDAILGVVPGLAGMHDIDDYPEAETIPGLVIYRYDSPLFFANAEDFRRRALAAVDRSDAAGDEPTAWFVLNAESNVEVDITALEAVEAVRQELAARGIVFALARVKQDLLVDLEAFGLADAVGRDRIFPTLPTAVAAYHEWRRRHHRPAADGPG